MGLITTQIPQVGSPNSTEDPKVASDINTITTVINGNLDKTNLSAALQAIVPGDWTTYTPTWTCAITNPTLGNGTLQGAYQTFNKTCIFRVKLTFGSTTSGGEGAYSFSLPTSYYSGGQPTEGQLPIGSCSLVTASIGQYAGLLIPATTSTFQAYVPFAATSSVLGPLVNADATGNPGTGWPFTSGTYPMLVGCTLMMTGTYRTA